jgi:signal transduction histidine kinase
MTEGLLYRRPRFAAEVTIATWYRRHWFAVDVALAVFFVLLDTGATLVGASWWPVHPGPLAWGLLALQAAACGSLVARRRAPLLVIAILGGFTLAVTLLIWPAGALVPAHPANLWAPFGTVLASYGPFYYREDRRRAFLAVGLLTVIVARPWQPSAIVITIAVLRTAVPPLVALYFGARRCMVQSLKERAERAERERYLLAEQARTEERARLAGEMHDVVTHRVSLMVLQAGALRMTAPDEATRQAAEELRAAGCQALDELRDLVGILRTAPDGGEVPSAPGLAALVAESVKVGTPAELVEDGDPSLASPVVGRTVYRIVRESLTNVRKHAPGTRVTVRVSYGPSQLRLTIRNTRPDQAEDIFGGAVDASGGAVDASLGAVDASGRARDASGRAGDASRLAGTGSGLGIAQLRQRVELVHGTLRAGPVRDGGFCVEATLPAYVPTAESAA